MLQHIIFFGNGSQLTGVSASETFWNGNYTNFSNIYDYENNGTFAANNSATFYATTLYSNSQNVSTANNYLINGSLIPNNSATFYVTNTIWDAGQNLSLGYQYATNITSNFSTIYAYALNASLWTLNFTNFSNVYDYINNGTNLRNNTVFYGTTVYGGNQNLSQGNQYATNGTLFAINGTNSIGFLNFNVSSFDINFTSNYSVFFINGSTEFIGINTTTPQNLLNVLGTANITTALYVNGSNVSQGLQYATNGSYIASTNNTYGYS